MIEFHPFTLWALLVLVFAFGYCFCGLIIGPRTERRYHDVPVGRDLRRQRDLVQRVEELSK